MRCGEGRSTMPMNALYRGPGDLPEMIPVFPLPGALLLPRGQMPLNIFEPRYLAMIDDALRDGHRLIGMIQPDPAHAGTGRQADAVPGRLRRPHHPVRRDRRRPLSDRADRHLALPRRGGAHVATAYRQCRVTYRAFAGDFVARKGEDEVDRKARAEGLRRFPRRQQSRGRLGGRREGAERGAGQRARHDAPFGAAEKQALLEAPDLKTRAEMLVAITEIELARDRGGEPPLQ